MNIENKLNEILAELKRIETKISDAKKELKSFRRDKKRAKSDTAKESIQQGNIDPIHKRMGILRAENEKFSMQLLAIESHVLEEEISTRQSGTTTVTKVDDKYRLKFLFSRLRRFGNFTGYLSGRKEEADNSIKNYLIKKEVYNYIRTYGRDNLYNQYGIDPNSKTALEDLRESIIADRVDNLDERLSLFKSQVINENTVSGTVGREEMIAKLIKRVPKKAPDTPYLDSFNMSSEDAEHEEETDEIDYEEDQR